MKVVIGFGELSLEVGVAGSFISRLLGWFAPSFSNCDGVLIYPCRSIHTFFMKSPIDIVFVSESGMVAEVFESVRPFRVVGCVDSSFVLELKSGLVRSLGIEPGRTFKLNAEM